MQQSSTGAATGRRVALAIAALAASLVVGACLPSSIRPTSTPGPVATPAPATLPAPTATAQPPTAPPGPEFVLHKVVRGDTLTSLARTYRTTGRSIAYWNRDTYPSLDPESPDYAPDDLKRGWVLRLLPGEEYSPPPDDGETDEEVTPEPEDDFETEAPSATADAATGEEPTPTP